jgi:hypothetical protein
MTSLETIDDNSEIQYVEPTPSEMIEMATARANALAGVVDTQELYVMIQGKKYLKAEAWQTVAALNVCHFETQWTKPIRNADEDEITGYLAKVNLVDQQGNIRGSGIMPCGYDDFPCRGKTGTPRDRAAMSAAQTWAGSKAARATFAWVVTLAGYEPTPADEMTTGPQEAATQPRKAPTPPKPQRATLARKWSNAQWSQILEAIAPRDQHDIKTLLSAPDTKIASFQLIVNSMKFANSDAFAEWCNSQWADGIDAEQLEITI